MERGFGWRGLFVFASVSLAGCAPSIGGLAASGGGSGGSTIVNATVSVTAPAAYVASTSLAVTVTTNPPGQAMEASLDAGAWTAMSSPWEMTGLSQGTHTATIRAARQATTAQTIDWVVDTLPPDTPTNVTVTATRAAELDLTWTAAMDDVTEVAAYSIRYGTDSGALTELASTAAPEISETLSGLDACATYFVTVTSVDLAGNTSTATTEVSTRANCGGDGRFIEEAVALTDTVEAITKGDFNSDGILDLAVSDNDDLKLMFGDGADGLGNGSWTFGTTINAGARISAIEVGDFNADKIQDLAILNSTELRIYTGQGSNGVGDGTFTLTETLTTNLTTPQALHVCDVNGDRIQDLLIGDWSGNRLVTYVGDGSNGQGDGTFTYDNQVGTGTAPGAIASGDFNADGIADVAIACQSGVEVLVTHLGNGSGGVGDGTFAAAQTWLSGGFVAGDVLVGDMNGDTIDDLIVPLSLANSVAFMAGSGTGGIGTGTFYIEEVVGTGKLPWGLIAGEFTGDNITDYVALSFQSEGCTLMASNGSNGRGNATFTASQIGGTGARMWQGVSGDTDGNGSQDIMVADLNGGVVVLRNYGKLGVGDGSFEARGNEPSAIFSAYGVGAQDLNSDKVPDVMIASFQRPYSGGTEFVLRYMNVASGGLGTGSLPIGSLQFSVGSGPTAFAFGDFLRNGIIDTAIVASDLDLRGGGDRVDLWMGDGNNGVGDGTIASSSSVAVGTTPRGITRGDFNADGILDLAVANNGSDTVTVLLGSGSGARGDGAFVAQTPIAVSTKPFTMLAGDFNDDGITDLAVGSAVNAASSALTILTGQGSGGIGDGTFSVGTPMVTANQLTGLVQGDFTGDGITDLVGSQYRSTGGNTTSGVIMFAGNGSGGRGNGTFTAGSELAIDGNAYAIAAGDFDHDNILDLAVTDADSAAMAILIGAGSNGRSNGSFASPVSVPLLAASVAITQTDLDSDGVLDLIAVGTDQISVMFGTGLF